MWCFCVIGYGCYPEQEEGEELSSEHMSPLPRGHQALDGDREASLLDGDGSVEWQWGGEKAEDAAVREQECVEEGVDSDEEEKTKDMEEGEVSGSSPEKQDKEVCLYAMIAMEMSHLIVCLSITHEESV